MIVLVLGGTRSGKSGLAEALATSWGPSVTYLATAVVDPADADQLDRVTRHRERRPAEWTTVECTTPSDLPEALATAHGPVLVDSLGSWVTLHRDLSPDAATLISALASRTGPTVLVSEEVGMAVHPTTEAGRRFTDELGTLNAAVAAVADRVLLVVAGRAIDLPAHLPGIG